MPIQVTNTRNRVEVSPTTNEVVVQQTLNRVEIGGPAHPQSHGLSSGDHVDLLVTAGVGLNVDFAAGRVRIDQTVFEIAAGSLAMAASQTNFVFVNSSGVVATNTTGFPSNTIPLATVTTSGAAVTAIVDKRAVFYEDTAAGGGGGGAPLGAGYLVTVADVDLTGEVVVGLTPGGELGGTWPAPTVNATHSGSSHADAAAAGASVADAHIADASDAHDASAISIVDAAGDFTATEVEGALAELQADAEAHAAAGDPHPGYQTPAEHTAIGDGAPHHPQSHSDADHTAGFAAPTGAIDIGDASGSGAATTHSRSDHQHQVPAPAGGYPQAVAAAAADGTATTPARSDHAHAHGSGYLPDAHHAQAHPISGGDHSGAISTTQHGAMAGPANAHRWADIDKTTSALSDIATRPHSALGSIGTDDHHAKLHAIDDAAHHSGVISATQHGTPAGDLHTPYFKADGTRDITGAFDIEKASGVLFTGTVTGEANPRIRVQHDRYELRTGGAATSGMDMRRQSVTQIDFVRDVTAAPILRGRIEADTQPRWRATGGAAGGFEVGIGGSTAADTGFLRNTDPGRFRVRDYLELSNLLTKPMVTVSVGLNGSPPIFLYGRSPNGDIATQAKLYAMLESGAELGPLGTFEGDLSQYIFPYGGFSINNPNGVQGLGGASFWGQLAVPTIIGTANTADAAYSPTVTLTTTINATETGLAYTSTGDPIFAGDIIVIGTERILVQSINDTTNGMDCIRGVQGTTAAGHTAGAAISRAGVTSGTQARWGWDGGPCLEQDTGASSGTDAGLEWPVFMMMHDQPLLVYQFHQYDITDQRLFVGFSDQTLAVMNASDNPAGHYAGLQFSTNRGDTNFKFVTKDGVTQNLQDVGIPPTGASPSTEGPHWYLRILGSQVIRFTLFDETWAPFGDIEFTTNLPFNYAPQRLMAGVRNLAAVSKRFQHRFGSFMVRPSAA